MFLCILLLDAIYCGIRNLLNSFIPFDSDNSYLLLHNRAQCHVAFSKYKADIVQIVK